MLSRRIPVLVASLLLLAFGPGCYETKYPLGSAADATVNRAYVGNFALPDQNNTSDSIVIRNLDGKQYFVEWINPDPKSQPMYMVGYTADVNGVTFANLRQLSDDGSIDNQFMIMRVALSADGSKLTVRNLNDKFFDGKSADSQAALTQVIAGNLDNDAMYDGPAAIASRVSPTTAPSASN
jgi:hypothetical protein